MLYTLDVSSTNSDATIYLPAARHSFKTLHAVTCIIFNRTKRYCSFHFTDEDIENREVSNIPKVTQLVRGRAGCQTLEFLHLPAMFFHLPTMKSISVSRAVYLYTVWSFLGFLLDSYTWKAGVYWYSISFSSVEACDQKYINNLSPAGNYFLTFTPLFTNVSYERDTREYYT